MKGKLIGWLLAGMLGVAHAGSAFAFFHLWRINEIYSNADGTVQFIELICTSAPSCPGETVATAAPITVTPTGGSSRTFNFPNNLSSAPFLDRKLLIATQGFANLNNVPPDFIMPSGFLPTNGGQFNLGGFDIITLGALPKDGLRSLNRSGVAAQATPQNYAGSVGILPFETLDVFIGGQGTGTVTFNPVGVGQGGDDFSAGCSSGTCSQLYGLNAPVTLTATPAPGSIFFGFTINCAGIEPCSLTMAGPREVSAAFGSADILAPSVPTGVTATSNSANAVRLTWNPSTDNVAVDHYHVFLTTQGGIQIGTVLHPATTFHHFGLAGSTLYGYAVNACDASDNCSAQSSPAVSATTAPGGGSSYTAALESGFNLIGNSLGLTLDVIGTFGTLTSPVPGVSDNVLSVWKWNAASGRWAFHTPLLSAADSATYAAVRNYDPLVVIEPGEGYWVNAGTPMSLPLQTGGAPFGWSTFNFTTLASGFNLIATGSSVTPSQFNVQVSETPPVPGEVPTSNFVSLWAWDALFGRWYFYSPILESSGGLPAVKAYADSHNYLHFQDPPGRMLGIGTGFWVNRP